MRWCVHAAASSFATIGRRQGPFDLCTKHRAVEERLLARVPPMRPEPIRKLDLLLPPKRGGRRFRSCSARDRGFRLRLWLCPVVVLVVASRNCYCCGYRYRSCPYLYPCPYPCPCACPWPLLLCLPPAPLESVGRLVRPLATVLGDPRTCQCDAGAGVGAGDRNQYRSFLLRWCFCFCADPLFQRTRRRCWCCCCCCCCLYCSSSCNGSIFDR
mmetsp:Transcript_23081/g.50368  ORF Transcript_23081/g.50368 Transcript_23081/m.50368 type:complete len:213 (-) Transcript_23081:110-748(-)